MQGTSSFSPSAETSFEILLRLMGEEADELLAFSDAAVLGDMEEADAAKKHAFSIHERLILALNMTINAKVQQRREGR